MTGTIYNIASSAEVEQERWGPAGSLSHADRVYFGSAALATGGSDGRIDAARRLQGGYVIEHLSQSDRPDTVC